MTSYLTSDLHMGHSRILEYCNRPFESVEHMAEEITRRHNAIVKPDDYVFMLGDMALNFKYVEQYIPRMNGKKFLVPGNHDEVHPSHKKSKKSPQAHEEWLKKYVSHGGFLGVLSLAHRLPNDLLVSHMPYRGSGDHAGGLERYSQYRLEDKGGYLAHGHLHGKYRKKGRMIDIGVDAWNFTPVSMDQIEALIALGPEVDLPPLPMTSTT